MTTKKMFLVVSGGDGYSAEIVAEEFLEDAFVSAHFGTPDGGDEEEIRELLEAFRDDENWGHNGLHGKVQYSCQYEDGYVHVQLVTKPINMVLWCPNCGTQHIDLPNKSRKWANPPHRTHECQTCGHLWRPCDLPTNGVTAIQTQAIALLPGVQATPAAAVESGQGDTLDSPPIP